MADADILSALQTANRSSSVLNAIANPAQVNPLAAMSAGVSAARNVVDLRSQQFNLQQSQLGPAYQSMRMLMATNPNPTDDDVKAALAQSARIGGNVDGLVQNYTDFRARGGKPGEFVRATALGGMSPENQVNYGVGGPVTQDTGTNIVFGMRGGPLSSAPGQFTGATSIQKGFTPSEASEFISVPDVDANGRPTGTYTMKPRGTVFGTGVPGGGSSGVGGAALLPPGASADVAAARVDQIAQRESGNQNIPNRQGPGGAPLSTASGPYQFLDSTWQQAAREYGIPNPTQRAIQTDPAIQRAVAIKYLQNHGEAPWAQSAPGGARGGGGGGGGPASGPFIGATSTQPVGGGGGNVQPAGGMQYLDPTGRPIVQGGGPGGGGRGPILTPPSPYELPQFEQSAKDYVADQVNNRTLSRRIAPLQSAISLIKENPGLVTGPSAENWYQWVQGLAAATGIDVGDVHNANAYQELTKQLAMNLQQSGADPTDMARLMHEASQPNTTQGRQAIVTLAAEQIGYQRMKSAQYLEFRSRHPTDANTKAQFYHQETGDWASQQDPMAYAADLIPQAELQAHLRGLNPDQQRAFAESLNNAKRLFKFKLPTGGQNGG